MTNLKFPHRRQFLHLAAGAATLPVVPRISKAQSYPSRPVRLIVGYAAGGLTDTTARVIGQWLSDRFGQPFLIENRAGAGTNIATEVVVKAPPDGHTLLLATSANAINATLYDKLNFNFIREMAPVASIVDGPMSWKYIHPSQPTRFQSSLPTPRPIAARSTWLQPALGARLTLPANCSR
jgi:tripartite-type tricarboxylate transporter receptor subunit TctC